MVEHTCGDVAPFSQVSLVSSKDLPSVVVNILDVGVGALKVWHAILVPRSVVAKIFLGQCMRIKATSENWRSDC